MLDVTGNLLPLLLPPKYLRSVLIEHDFHFCSLLCFPPTLENKLRSLELPNFVVSETLIESSNPKPLETVVLGVALPTQNNATAISKN
jgi:hypothetical protein